LLGGEVPTSDGTAGTSGHAHATSLTQSFIDPAYLLFFVKGDSFIEAKKFTNSAARARAAAAKA
jgi:hypothetical protein